MISRWALEGPPAPAVLRDSIGLTGEQLQRYAQRYASHMATTGSARDSLRTTIRSMRAAFESGDRSGARSRHDTLDRQAEELSKRDQEFEKALRQDLSKDQRKRYDKWKESRENAAREHRHHRRRGPAGNL
jgi:alkanesulfonate monooxygenase SsuD/methylene tetrahydromethanopterin reductase-like flavin-dependent oxidoreductase (luciferase family)